MAISYKARYCKGFPILVAITRPVAVLYSLYIPVLSSPFLPCLVTKVVTFFQDEEESPVYKRGRILLHEVAVKSAGERRRGHSQKPDG